MKTILLCLHGWGGSKESFIELREALRGIDMEILTPNLPGFGAEPEPPKPWGIEEYAEWVERRYSFLVSSFLEKKNNNAQPATIQPANGTLFVLGHSLGGQIAVKLALRGNPPIHHLFLCAPAAIRPRFSLRRMTGYMIAKTGKVLFSIPGLHLLQPLLRTILYKLMGVHDYERASSVMQRTMIRVTHQDLTAELHKIQIPTDLFWGEDDHITPLKKGLLMQKLIPRSTLHTYPGTRHSVHRDRAVEIAKIIQCHAERLPAGKAGGRSTS